MMIEQNTNYAYKLKYMDNPSFDKVRDLATKFYRELPQALQDELYDALNRGVDILDSEPQMTSYLIAFGKMHQAKLNYAFDYVSAEFLLQPEINIIDYGCGQAIGTMCYADYLRKNGYSQKVKTITLIEPSEICLKRAALHVSVFFPDAEIITVNKKFDGLTQGDIVCNEKTPTLHIFSNVLDILEFDLYKFSQLIQSILGENSNLFVCVSPYFKDYERDIRMRQFSSALCNDFVCKVLDKKDLDVEKDWTCQMCCFSTGKNHYQFAINTVNSKSNTVSEINQGFPLKEFLMKNGANGNFNVYRNTEQTTGRTFFALGFIQPGQTIKNSRGQDVQKHFILGFSKGTEKYFGINEMTPEQVRDFSLEHASEWRVTMEPISKYPVLFLPNVTTNNKT